MEEAMFEEIADRFNGALVLFAGLAKLSGILVVGFVLQVFNELEQRGRARAGASGTDG
jgi:hypothetical protein